MKMLFNFTKNLNYRFIFASFIFITFVSLNVRTNVFAAVSEMYDAETVCKPAKKNFEWNWNVFEAIRQTSQNVFTSKILDSTVSLATGVDLDTYLGCTGYVVSPLQGAFAPGSVISNVGSDPTCGDTAPEICTAIFKTSDVTGETGGGVRTSNQKNVLANSMIGGSLLGMANSVERSVYEPLPVNMAYYIHDVGSRLPVVGDRVYAATNVQYSPLVEDIFGLWSAVKNISYGLIAIVMAVTGISIIMGKKVSSQMVVSIQYSLPKIIIALVLITFSYPIGATIATLGWSLFRSASDIVYNSVGVQYRDMLLTLTGGFGIGGMIILILVIIFGSMGAGATIILTLVIVAVIVLGLYLVVNLKALIEFIKIIFQIVLMPIEFVMYALPGNDDRLANWAKKMFAYLLSMFLLGSVIAICNYIVFSLVVSGGDFAGVLYLVFAPFIVYLFGLSFAIAIPKKVEGWIMGEQKKR